MIEKSLGTVSEEHLAWYNGLSFLTGSVLGVSPKKKNKSGTMQYDVEFCWTGFGQLQLDYKFIPPAVIMGEKIFKAQQLLSMQQRSAGNAAVAMTADPCSEKQLRLLLHCPTEEAGDPWDSDVEGSSSDDADDGTGEPTLCQ